MGLFDSIKNWMANSRIRGLESQLHGRPTPALYLQLADAYLQVGNSQRAMQILRLGATRYPDAPEIARRQLEAEQRERVLEKDRLQRRIQDQPNPILYARLADLFRTDKDVNRAIQVCNAGIKAFPKYAGTYLVLGQIHSERQEWDEAMNQLTRAVDHDKFNYMALKLLAQVHLQLGNPSEAVRRLEEILFFAPGDEAILELLKKAREAGGAPKAAPARAEPAVAAAAPRRVAGTMMMAERRGTAVVARKEPPRAEPVAGARDRLLNENIARLREVEGCLGAILVDQFGLVVAASLDQSLDEGLAGALVTNIFRTTTSQSERLGVGVFEESLLEGETGNVHLAQLGETILAVFATSKARLGLLEKGIRDFAAAVTSAR
jgi:predicted regulator of Ras-like GTPase activity (Roadblock/LC7/MglB family)